MHKETLKKLLHLKLELVDTLVKELPESIQETVMDIEKSFMEALSEVAAEYLEKQSEVTKQKPSSEVNEIHID